ncbi:MAG: nuclear transport factor 2 family protein [Alphaproteobacteria bacterium]|nr:nuclear transport factor 2 family protein [Alphaproteobacteria bacterium]
MNLAFAQNFLSRFAQTAIAGDHAAHMNMISKKVRLYGMPGFEAINYEDWSQQCAHEFAQGLMKSISYLGLEMKMETDTLICVETHETIEAKDGTVNSHALEIFIEREDDGEWRLVQERILPMQTH